MKKNMVHFSLLVSLLAVCIYFVLFGQRGIMKYYEVSKEIRLQKAKIARLEQKNEKLKLKIDKWQKDDFEKEKFARQDLQFAKPHEMVFVTTTT